MGVTKGDSRSLDHGSHGIQYLLTISAHIEAVHSWPTFFPGGLTGMVFVA